MSNDRFNFVSKATNDGIYDWNLLDSSVWFSDGFQKLFGYKKEEIIFTLDWWVGQIHPEDKLRIDKEIDEALGSDKDSMNLNYRFKKGNGSFADVQDRAYLVRDFKGKAIRFIGVMQNITENKQYENELKKRTEEAERLNKITVDREIKMIELKKELAKYKNSD